MPLLQREPDVYPESIFDIDEGVAPWAVAHVRSRQEKVLARHLLQRSVPFYLPTTEQSTIRSGRRFRSFIPLFSGYVFFRRTPATDAAVWRSGVAVSLVDVPDQHQLQFELKQIFDLHRGGALLRPAELLPGTPVRVGSGAFAGYTGIVSESRGETRLIVSLTMLRKAVAVEFDRSMLSAVRAG